MSNSLCKTSVFKAYQDVIGDVISNIREHFLEDGVDEIVLQELKQLWENKLAATKAVTENKEPEKVIVPSNKSAKSEYNSGNAYLKNTATVQQIQLQQQQIQQQQQQIQQQQLQQQLLNKQVVGQVPPNNHIPQGPLGQAFPEWRRVPIQLTIPSAPGSADAHRILSVDVPELFLQGPHLKSILTGQVISTTMELPLMAACAYLQNHVDLAFHKHQESVFALSSGAVNSTLLQTSTDVTSENKIENRLLEAPQRDTAADTSGNDPVYNNVFNKPDPVHHDKNMTNRMIQQQDGPADSSDDDDDDDKSDDRTDNEVDDDDRFVDDMEEDANGIEEEPLNSGDDVSDVDVTEEFQTDNVIVCQYDKITRSRNRWKFHLKDGIMNLNGEDFVFQKANGDAEW